MTRATLVEANGARIPAIGLGTWPLTGEACSEAVRVALEVGYRHIDTAAIYGNEEAVGAGLRAGGVPRDEIFVTTKVWWENLGGAKLERSAEASLQRLGLDQVDLLLIHWPNPDLSVAEVIPGLCAAKRAGLARHIGISNFTAAMVEEAVKITTEPLVDNQCEYHPYLDQSRVMAATRRHGLAFTSYSPLGRAGLTEEPVLRDIAAAHGKTFAQVILRWHVQQPGVVAIPKASSRAHIAENLDVFDFALSEEEMRRISALARSGARVVNPVFAPAWDNAA
jgi:diketogulonate reductase-like aldo/keto reductase